MTPEEFIFEYLKADQDTGAGSYEKMLSFIKDLDWGKVKPSIVKLRYFYFLRTSYWRIISDEIKRRAGWRCSCGRRENLEVHHTENGNENHGEEHLLVGLECKCKKCHDKVHGNSVKSAEKKRQRDNRKEQILLQIPEYPKVVSEERIKGYSVVSTRKLLEELEHDKKIVIKRDIYEGWKIYR